MNVRIVAAVLLVGASGCAAGGRQRVPLPSSYEVHVSTDFGPEDQAAALDALSDWQGAGAEFRVILTNDACPAGPTIQGMESCFSISPQSALNVEQDCGDDSAVVGCTYVTGGQVVSTADASPGAPDIKHVLTHEVGHALGLQHVLDPLAVMYPTTAGASSVGPLDVAQYQAMR